MLTEEERDMLGIDKWLKMHHLYMKVSRYMTPEEMGYTKLEGRKYINEKVKHGYFPPDLRVIFGNAMSSSNVPKDVKRDIAWSLGELEIMKSITKKSRR